MDNLKKGNGRSRLPPPPLRKDALVSQAWREQQGTPPLSPMPARGRSSSEPLPPKPLTGSQRRAEKRQQNAAATTIQKAFRSFQFRKGLKAASPDLQESIKGNTPPKLTALVGKSYEESGRVRKTVAPVVKPGGRLAGNWSGGVDTQKGHLEEIRKATPSSTRDPIGTTHHTVSDHFLGFVDEGIKRLEGGSAPEKAAAGRFRTQVATDTLYAGPDHEKALFQVRQNLTFGPGSDFVKGDPGVGFDATFEKQGKNKAGLKRDWDQRSSAIRPMHNLGLLLKSGGYELTPQGADHITGQLQKARTSHDKALTGQTYDTSETRQQKVPNPAWDPKKPAKGVSKTITEPVTTVTTHPQTIPVHGEKSGHFDAVSIVRKDKSVVPGFSKKKWNSL
ncbi:MAG: hypothetical protein JWN23_2958 [Rhodocyclales bacterium]|nr:hypothetical protein [Rhodocyclales bacterium]